MRAQMFLVQTLKYEQKRIGLKKSQLLKDVKIE